LDRFLKGSVENNIDKLLLNRRRVFFEDKLIGRFPFSEAGNVHLFVDVFKCFLISRYNRAGIHYDVENYLAVGLFGYIDS
jgi:hypothetical protein